MRRRRHFLLCSSQIEFINGTKLLSINSTYYQRSKSRTASEDFASRMGENFRLFLDKLGKEGRRSFIPLLLPPPPPLPSSCWQFRVTLKGDWMVLFNVCRSQLNESRKTDRQTDDTFSHPRQAWRKANFLLLLLLLLLPCLLTLPILHPSSCYVAAAAVKGRKDEYVRH